MTQFSVSGVVADGIHATLTTEAQQFLAILHSEFEPGRQHLVTEEVARLVVDLNGDTPHKGGVSTRQRNSSRTSSWTRSSPSPSHFPLTNVRPDDSEGAATKCALWTPLGPASASIHR